MALIPSCQNHESRRQGDTKELYWHAYYQVCITQSYDLRICVLATIFFLNFKAKKCRSIPSDVFLGKSILKICSKFTGEHPCLSVISIKLLTEITLWHGCSPVNLLHIFRTPFYGKITYGGLLLEI